MADKTSLVPVIGHAELERELELNYRNRRSTYVEGPPGIGKTEANRKFALTLAERYPEKGFVPEAHYVEMRPVYMDPTMITGVIMPDRETGTADHYPLASWPTVANIEAGMFPKHGIVCLDEMPNAPRMVLNSLLELLNDHAINRSPLGEGWMVTATGNRAVDNTGSNTLPMALVSRIAWYSLVVGPEDFLRYGTETGSVTADVLAFYTKIRADLLMTFDPTRQEPYSCPRSIVALSKKLAAFESAYPGKTVPDYTLTSIAGNSAKVFLGMRSVLTECPDWRDIEDDPQGCKVPASKLAVFNTAITLGQRVDGTNLTKVFPYIKRLGDDEIVNLTMSSILHRFESSGISHDDARNPQNTAAFTEWCAAYNRAKRGL